MKEKACHNHRYPHLQFVLLPYMYISTSDPYAETQSSRIGDLEL